MANRLASTERFCLKRRICCSILVIKSSGRSTNLLPVFGTPNFPCRTVSTIIYWQFFTSRYSQCMAKHSPNRIPDMARTSTTIATLFSRCFHAASRTLSRSDLLKGSGALSFRLCFGGELLCETMSWVLSNKTVVYGLRENAANNTMNQFTVLTARIARASFNKSFTACLSTLSRDFFPREGKTKSLMIPEYLLKCWVTTWLCCWTSNPLPLSQPNSLILPF